MPDALVRLECVLCHAPFTQEDILKFNYFFENGLCYQCCRKLYKLPKAVSCFGKRYSALALECKKICPDRKVCPLFQSKEIREMRKEALTDEQRRGALQLLRAREEQPRSRAHPFQRGSVIFKAFELCRKGCDKDDLKQFVSKQHADLARILRIFRREEAYGKRWVWRESAAGYSIRYPKKD